jgi:hypothetical protein
VKRLREPIDDPFFGPVIEPIKKESADRIEQLEKGFREILTLDSPMLMQIIARACLTGAIDADGKYCFVPPFALGEKKDD